MFVCIWLLSIKPIIGAVTVIALVVIPVAVVARTSLGEDEAGGQEDTRSRSISNGKEYTSKKS